MPQERGNMTKPSVTESPPEVMPVRKGMNSHQKRLQRLGVSSNFVQRNILKTNRALAESKIDVV